MEAMASGLPIVSTAVGGVPDLFENGKQGITMQPGNVRDFSTSMEYLLRNREVGLSLGMAAALRAREKFDVSTMVKSYEGLYEELVDDPHHLTGKSVIRESVIPAETR